MNPKLLTFELQQAYETMRTTYNIIWQFVSITFAVQIALIGFGAEHRNAYLIILGGILAFFLLYEIRATSRVLTVVIIKALTLEHLMQLDPNLSVAGALVTTIRSPEILQRLRDLATRSDSNWTESWSNIKSEPTVYSFKYSRTVKLVWFIGISLMVSGVILLFTIWGFPSM